MGNVEPNPNSTKRWRTASPAARSGHARRRLIVGTAILISLVALYAATSWYTNRSAFCNSCHEMTPYYTAWEAGPHGEVACVSCHVDPGVIAGFAHKFVALKEVWVHFTGDPTFPAPDVSLPNGRCVQCHDGTIDPGIEGFDHEEHRDDRTCKTCHDATGHSVTAKALEQAGILNAVVQAQRDARRGIVVGTGSALPGHVAVGCSDCHDMAVSLCIACHEPPDDHPLGPCATCHTPGPTWAFAHPASPECSACHRAPASHYDAPCATCHAPDRAWESATFEHPRIPGGEHSYREFPCVDCHPTDGAPAVCTKCHEGGAPDEDDDDD